MKQVYQLLRNNRLSGPYTLDELKRQHLQASDLVWAEGISTAWTEPSHLPELQKTPCAGKRSAAGTTAPSIAGDAASRGRRKPALAAQSGTSAPDPQPVTLSLEQQAEELRARALSYTPVRFYGPVIQSPSEACPVVVNEEEEIDLVIHKPEGGVTLSQLVLVGLMTTIAAAGWYGSWAPVRPKPDTVNATALPARFTEEVRPVVKLQHAVQVSTPPQQEQGLIRAVPVKKRAVTIPGPKAAGIGKTSSQIQRERAGEVPAARQEEKAVPAPLPAAVAETPVKDVQPSPGEAVQPETTSKKKTLGQALKNLFRKKKKADAAPAEASAESANER